MRPTVSAAAAALLLAVAACGGPAPAQRPDHCDVVALGACVVADRPVDPAHVERALRMALAYWNAPEATVAGWALVFHSAVVSCNGAPASGCTHLDGSELVDLQMLDPACLETAQLVHELGHVIHGDPDHAGPWWSWEREQAQTFAAVREPGASPSCAASRYYVHAPAAR